MKRFKVLPHAEWIPLIILALLTNRLIDQLPMVGAWFGKVGSTLVPFIWAFIIAYFLGPVVDLFQKRGLKRMPALGLTYLSFLSVIILVLVLVVPMLVINIQDIVATTPEYLVKADTFIQENAQKYGGVTTIDYEKYLNISDPDALMKELGKYVDIFSGLVMGFLGFTTGIVKFILGLIISIYLLADLDGFKRSAERGLNAIFKSGTVVGIKGFLIEVNDIFGKYFVGQALDSLVVALVAFVGFSLIGVPYAVLMALVVGVTNMIPYFGPIFGMVPVVGITLFYDPMTALYALLFILLLQQIDGYLIAPKIVGGAVGITPFWSILAILLGGSLFGVVGMIVCVPVFAITRNQIRKIIERRLDERFCDNVGQENDGQEGEKILMD